MELADQLTIVLLTYNSSRWLMRTLDRLSETTESLRIIAVDNASKDGTVEILQRYPGVEVIALKRNLGAAARNYGVQAASTPYVVICDDDTWWEEGSLYEAVKLFNRYPRLGLVTARILVGPKGTLDPISRVMASSPLPDDAGIPGRVLMSFMGGASMVRRKAYLEVGGYDPRIFMGGEEQGVGWQLAMAGWQMRYCPQLVVHHYPSLQNYRRMRPYGLRNTIWNAWMFRPFRSAVRQTITAIASQPRISTTLQGMAMAVAGLPWVLRERRVMPPHLENKLRILEHHNRALKIAAKQEELASNQASSQLSALRQVSKKP